MAGSTFRSESFLHQKTTENLNLQRKEICFIERQTVRKLSIALLKNQIVFIQQPIESQLALPKTKI